MQTQPNKGKDIKKNPSRDYEKNETGSNDENNFDSNQQRNEINPGKLGDNREIDLDRSGVREKGKFGSNGTASSDPGLNQTQQMQKQPLKNTGSPAKKEGNTDKEDADLDEDEVSFDSDVDTGVQKNRTTRPRRTGKDLSDDYSANI